MSILILQNSWFLAASDESLGNLRRVLNKSYDKVRYKFGIINSSRVKSSKSFLADFAIVKDKPFSLFLLLAPRNSTQDIDISTRFTKESTGIDDIYDSDFPTGFKFLEPNNELSTIIVDDNFQVTNDIIQRVVSTLAFKDEKSKHPTVRELELSAFTSFSRGSGPAFLNYVIEKCIKVNPVKQLDTILGIDRTVHNRVSIISVVIREHDLVRFYEAKLDFRKMEDDQLLEVSPDGRVKGLEDDVFAHKSFHLAFLSREIELSR